MAERSKCMQNQRLVIGTGRFVPARMKIARQARMLKQADLAERLGCSAATISKWEAESYDHAPDLEVVGRLGSELEVATSWFFKPYRQGKNTSFFRSLRSELVRSRDKIDARMDFLETIVEAISPHVEFPEVDVPEFKGFPDFREYRPEHIERFAMELRQHWGLGDEPVDNLLLIIENAGIVVAEDVFVSQKLDGISRWSSYECPMMLLARDKDVGVRRRFDAAHELGHLIMHRNVSPQDLKENFRLIEEQAMAFAGAFLLPSSSFVEGIFDTTLDCLSSIKLRWKVSIGAMIKRLSSLNLISEDYERNLWKYYSYRGWRGREPHDDIIEVERAENLRSAIELLAAESPRDLSSVIEESGLLPPDIINLSGVDESVLDLGAPVRKKIQLREGAKENIASSSDFADNVILFPSGRSD